MTREWLTEADDYICKLNESVQDQGKEELGEDPATRTRSLEILRDWIKENPRIENCRLDSMFLLRFLRFSKYSNALAQEVLERYLLLRQSYSMAFNNLDVYNERMENLLNRGVVLLSPLKDRFGRRLVIVRAGRFDPYKFNNQDACRLGAIVHETLMEDEESQIRGFVYLCDAKGIGFPHLTLFTPREAVRIVKNGEKTLPMRHKQVHAFNVPSSLKFAVDFGFSLISEKYRKRIQIHANLDEVGQFIDRKLLPKEYGGDMTIDEMIRITKQELAKHRDVILSHDKMKVKLECYSERARQGAVSALKQGIICNVEERRNSYRSELSGTFRKLEVD